MLNVNKKSVRLFLLAMMSACAAIGQNPRITIKNRYLEADYDPKSSILELKDLASGKVFLKKGEVPGVVSASSVPASDRAFGKGTAIKLRKTDGSDVLLSLFPGVPFLFVQERLVNESKVRMELQKIRPFTFLVDLQKPASGLKTLGTGGLLAPNQNPGSYVFLTTVDPGTRNGVVTGWLTNERGSGVVFSDTCNNGVRITPQIDYGRLLLPAGGSTALETLVIGYFGDARLGEEQFAAAIAQRQHIHLPQRRAVYCTWYSQKNGGAGSESSTIELSHFITQKLKKYGLTTIQIDDRWQDGGNFNGPRRGFDRVKPDGPYGKGMGATTRAITADGLTAGIWWMPFSRNHGDPEYKDRQSWFARRLDGTPYETKWGGTSLDLTNPHVQDHLEKVAQTLHGWGFNYFKMDGLWTGTVTEQVYINDGYKDDHMGNCLPLFDSTKTQIEAYRGGLRLLRSAVGKDVFFSGCCASQNMRSFGASMGLVDAMRVGPDFNHDGQSIRTGAIRASRLYFLNGRVWWNDPDPCIIRESGQATADGGCKGIGSLERARLLPSWVALSGQFYLSSDWLPDLPEDRLDIMKRCMAAYAGVSRPVDAFSRNLPAIWLTTDTAGDLHKNVVGIFNWDTSRQTIGSNMGWTGLEPHATYHAFDFWENKPLPDIKDSFSYSLPGETCKIIALQKAMTHPVLVSTSRHITQGIMDVTREAWHGTALSGTSDVIGGDTYELRIAGLDDGGHWALDKAGVDGGNEGVTVSVLPAVEKGWLRVAIHSATSRKVNWSLTFKKENR